MSNACRYFAYVGSKVNSAAAKSLPSAFAAASDELQWRNQHVCRRRGGCHGDGCQAGAPDAPLRADDGVKREGGGSFINEDKEKEATRPAWSISGLTDRRRAELASEKKKTKQQSDTFILSVSRESEGKKFDDCLTESNDLGKRPPKTKYVRLRSRKNEARNGVKLRCCSGPTG